MGPHPACFAGFKRLRARYRHSRYKIAGPGRPRIGDKDWPNEYPIKEAPFLPFGVASDTAVRTSWRRWSRIIARKFRQNTGGFAIRDIAIGCNTTAVSYQLFGPMPCFNKTAVACPFVTFWRHNEKYYRFRKVRHTSREVFDAGVIFCFRLFIVARANFSYSRKYT